MPRVDRSRALPVRTGIGFYKTLGLGAGLAVVIWIMHGPEDTPQTPQAPATIVEQR